MKIRQILQASLAVSFALSGLIGAPSTPTAFAGTTITVTTTADELNTDGDCSLREAVAAANYDVAVDACPAGNGGDIVDLPAGTYNVAAITPGPGLTGTNPLHLIGSVTLRGAGAGV